MFYLRPSTTPAHKMFFDGNKVGKLEFNGRSKLPFAFMDVGQSFFVPKDELTEPLKVKIAFEVRTYNKRYNRVFRLIKRGWEWEIARIY